MSFKHLQLFFIMRIWLSEFCILVIAVTRSVIAFLPFGICFLCCFGKFLGHFGQQERAHSAKPIWAQIGGEQAHTQAQPLCIFARTWQDL
jgi:hypothetical protein